MTITCGQVPVNGATHSGNLHGRKGALTGLWVVRHVVIDICRQIAVNDEKQSSTNIAPKPYSAYVKPLSGRGEKKVQQTSTVLPLPFHSYDCECSCCWRYDMLLSTTPANATAQLTAHNIPQAGGTADCGETGTDSTTGHIKQVGWVCVWAGGVC